MKRTSSRLALVVLAASLVATQASALEKPRRGYAAMVAQTQQTQSKVPASFRIIQDDSREPGKLDGTSRYFGGEIRAIIVNGRAIRLPERVIIESIRSGHFVPVYSESGTRLSRADWEGSLPHWLGYATSDYAAR